MDELPEDFLKGCTKSYFYNCSEPECYALIEILYLDNDTIEFRCINKNNPHTKKISIKEYLKKMKPDIKTDMCMNCHKKYEHYCLECEKHLCQELLESREHINHIKINIDEILPSKNDLKIIQKIINEYQGKNEFKDLKKLYDIIYYSFEEFSHNYYFALNLNYVLLNHINKNQEIKISLSEKELERINKIKNIKNKNQIVEAKNTLENSTKKDQQIFYLQSQLDKYKRKDKIIDDLQKQLADANMNNENKDKKISELITQIKNKNKMIENNNINSVKLINDMVEKNGKYKNNYKLETVNPKENINNYEKIISNLKEENKKLSDNLLQLQDKYKKEIQLNDKFNKQNNLLNNEIIYNVKVDSDLKKNEIKGIIEINSDAKMKDITLFKSNIKAGIDVYLNQKKINMIKDKNMQKSSAISERLDDHVFKSLNDNKSSKYLFFPNQERADKLFEKSKGPLEQLADKILNSRRQKPKYLLLPTRERAHKIFQMANNHMNFQAGLEENNKYIPLKFVLPSPKETKIKSNNRDNSEDHKEDDN